MPSSLPAPKRAKRATILLVEDDPFQAFAHRSALERNYPSVDRAANASDAFIRVQEPGIEETLALIVVGLRFPGMAGPVFVNELRARVPHVPLLVIGRAGESASDYEDGTVLFLPGAPSVRALLAAVKSIFSGQLGRAAA